MGFVSPLRIKNLISADDTNKIAEISIADLKNVSNDQGYCGEPIQNTRISRQDAAPTVYHVMWDPAKREKYGH
jgi:hypothetical protein